MTLTGIRYFLTAAVACLTFMGPNTPYQCLLIASSLSEESRPIDSAFIQGAGQAVLLAILLRDKLFFL